MLGSSLLSTDYMIFKARRSISKQIANLNKMKKEAMGISALQVTEAIRGVQQP